MRCNPETSPTFALTSSKMLALLKIASSAAAATCDFPKHKKYTQMLAVSGRLILALATG